VWCIFNLLFCSRELVHEITRKMKYLLAFDASPGSQMAVMHLTEMLRGIQSCGSVQVVVFGAVVAHRRGGATDDLKADRLHLYTQVKECAAQIVRTTDLPNDCVSVQVVQTTDVRKALLDVAREQRIGTIVVGSRGRSPLKRMLLGSLASFLVAHAPVPVLVVRDTAAATGDDDKNDDENESDDNRVVTQKVGENFDLVYDFTANPT
jgi:nucleotide-binding universal stress UspA family protein